ncbi:hypothetical protein Lal_00028190 [Lupinus albus]|nr:hypothetical protein Lal_00028190 [Lupinus albus]
MDIKIKKTICDVLDQYNLDDGNIYGQGYDNAIGRSSSVRHVDDNVAYDTMTSFEFVTILYQKKEIMGIVIVMQLVKATKALI